MRGCSAASAGRPARMRCALDHSLQHLVGFPAELRALRIDLYLHQQRIDNLPCPLRHDDPVRRIGPASAPGDVLMGLLIV